MKKLSFPKITENMKRRFMAGACAVLMIFVGIMAYFTSTEKVTNKFTVGNVKIDLIEPSFPGNADPDNVPTNKRIVDDDDKDISYSDANYILPGELVPKDPTIVNTGKNEAIVFMKVEIPTYTDVNGTVHELFVVSGKENLTNSNYNLDVEPTFKFSELTVGQPIADDSKLIYMGKATDSDIDGTNTTDNADEAKSHTYVFGYTQMLYPEATDKHVIDNDVYSVEEAQTTPKPFETDPLFRYVMLNPALNSIDPDEGQTLYTLETNADGNIIKREAQTKDINVYAYAIQAKGLEDVSGSTANNVTTYTSTELTTAWSTAKFGDLENSAIPDADNHNKYGIPTENYAGANSDPWTSGDGTPIENNNKNVLSGTVTYTWTDNSETKTVTVTYKKIEGSTDAWVGTYPDSSAGAWKIGETTIAVNGVSDYLKSNYTSNFNITLTLAEEGTAPTNLTSDSTPTVKTVTVNFAKDGTSYTGTFTKIGSNGYALTSGVGTLPAAPAGKGWFDSSNCASGTPAIENIATYLNDRDSNITSGGTITLSLLDVKTVTVTFDKESETDFTIKFTKVGTSDTYERLTSETSTFQNAVTGKGWYTTDTPTTADTAITDLNGVINYLKAAGLTFDENGEATTTIYEKTPPTSDP